MYNSYNQQTFPTTSSAYVSPTFSAGYSLLPTSSIGNKASSASSYASPSFSTFQYTPQSPTMALENMSYPSSSISRSKYEPYSAVPSSGLGAVEGASPDNSIDFITSDRPFEPEVSKVRRNYKRRLPAATCTCCGATETPEWRKGPSGSRTLCNACGLRYQKMFPRGVASAEDVDAQLSALVEYRNKLRKSSEPNLSTVAAERKRTPSSSRLESRKQGMATLSAPDLYSSSLGLPSLSSAKSLSSNLRPPKIDTSHPHSQTQTMFPSAYSPSYASDASYSASSGGYRRSLSGSSGSASQSSLSSLSSTYSLPTTTDLYGSHSQLFSIEGPLGRQRSLANMNQSSVDQVLSSSAYSYTPQAQIRFH